MMDNTTLYNDTVIQGIGDTNEGSEPISVDMNTDKGEVSLSMTREQAEGLSEALQETIDFNRNL